MVEKHLENFLGGIASCDCFVVEGQGTVTVMKMKLKACKRNPQWIAQFIPEEYSVKRGVKGRQLF